VSTVCHLPEILEVGYSVVAVVKLNEAARPRKRYHKRSLYLDDTHTGAIGVQETGWTARAEEAAET